MTIGTILVLIGVVLAVLDAVFANRVRFLLHVAIALIGLGVLMGAPAIIKVG
jgi:hypothetical protein